MPSLKKLLSRFNKEERRNTEVFIEKIVSLNWHGLDMKKLRGYQNIFRARKEKFRIVFVKERKEISIITIERRREDTYKF